MRKTRVPPWVLAAFAVIVLWSVPLPVRAQCSMCSATVANSAEGQQAARSINAGILVLLVPPVSMMCLIFVVAVRRRNPNGEDSDERSVREPGIRWWRRASVTKAGRCAPPVPDTSGNDFEREGNLTVFPSPGAQ